MAPSLTQLEHHMAEAITASISCKVNSVPPTFCESCFSATIRTSARDAEAIRLSRQSDSSCLHRRLYTFSLLQDEVPRALSFLSRSFGEPLRRAEKLALRFDEAVPAPLALERPARLCDG